MKFNIMEWKSVGLRCPDFNIQINKKGKSLPSFIQMPNGTGKTATSSQAQEIHNHIRLLIKNNYVYFTRYRIKIGL